MDEREDATGPNEGSADAAAWFAAGTATAFVVGSLIYALKRSLRQRRPSSRKRAAFVAYLREHLADAHAATTVVDQLRATHAGMAEGALAARLHDEFQDEQAVLTAVLADCGGSPRPLKRAAGDAADARVRGVADGSPGGRSLFRTLEALAIGVQGKRCLWRALQVLPGAPAPQGRSFVALEAQALDQWDAIDRWRRSLAVDTFAGTHEAVGDDLRQESFAWPEGSVH
jgi:hypothetical protein